MAGDYLHRDETPFGQAVWERIDEAVVGAAKAQMSARRLLHVEGPYGLGLKSLPAADPLPQERTPEGEAGILAAGAVPVAVIRSPFRLAARDIAACEQTGLPLDLTPAAKAAVACARQEDDLIFNGSKALGCAGLLGAKGSLCCELASWDEIGAAAGDLIRAVTVMDDAGFHGPYTLALAPALFNLLLRRYPQGGTEKEHVETILGDGVVKAPAIGAGGVLMASGKYYASIVLGQDLATAFVGPDGADYGFMVRESAVLRLVVPEAVCVLR